MNDKKIKKISNYIFIILTLWCSTTCLLTFHIYNNPRITLKPKYKETLLEDNMFTVPTEIIGYNSSEFTYEKNNYKGYWERYRVNEVDYYMYEIEYENYLDDPYTRYQFHLFIKKIKNNYRSFIYIYKKWYDSIPKQVFYRTNIDSLPFCSFIETYYNIKGLQIGDPWIIYEPLEIKKITVDFTKYKENLDFFKCIKIELNK